jgi:hypothetical protein
VSTLTINISCCLCSEKHKAKADVPNTWCIDSQIDVENGFCPDHSIIDEWRSAQCPGCVSGWQDCGLWKGFAYERYRHTMRDTLSEAELKAVACGTCPRRVNGTFGMSDGRLTDFDLSKKAETASGEAFVQAIRDYWLKYPKCAPSYDPSKVRP